MAHGYSTVSVHGGETRHRLHHGVTDAIVPSTAFTFPDTESIVRFIETDAARDEYARYSNPNQRALEQKLAQLDTGECSLLFSSGMSAITTLLLAKLSAGDEMIIFDECYHRTREFCVKHLGRYKVGVKRVKMNNFDALEAALSPNTRLVFSESPTNPHLSVLDITRLVELAKRFRFETVVDATLATPFNQRPLALGADYVVHSATKYLGGHHDVLAGVVTGTRDKLGDIRALRNLLGCIPSAHGCQQLQRGVKTLALRMAHQNSAALAVAEFLEAHPRIRKVYYPGLPSHPSYKLARETMTGFGGLVTFVIDGSAKEASRFVDAVRIPRIGPSLGGVEALIEQPYIMSYYKYTKAEREVIGIDDSMVRLALGIEDASDIMKDLEQALDQLA